MPTGYKAEQQKQLADAPRVGDFVERDIDGIWFPAKVLAVYERKYPTGSLVSSSNVGHPRQLAFDLVYLDDQNRESEVPEGDLRKVYDCGEKTKNDLLLLLPEEEEGPKRRDGEEPRFGDRRRSDGSNLEMAEEKNKAAAETTLHGEGEEKETESHRDDESDSDHEGPKVTIHSSRGTFDTKEDGSATAYIINGPETNVAAGSGLRGIRWLRGP
ncbi:unnamed protein product [Scytosiphon promiscuus]